MKKNILKFLGWLVVPYIMIFVFWNRLGKTGRRLGVAWAVIALIGAIINQGSSDKQRAKPVVAQVQTEQAKLVKEEVKEDKAKIEADLQAKKEVDEKVKLEADAKAKADAEAKKAQDEITKKANQDDVIAFEQSAYALEATAKPIFDNYQKIMTAVGTGKASIFDAYEATTNAKKAAESLQVKFNSLEVPKNLPKEVNTLLVESKQDLSTAYYGKKKAFDAVLKFLDDQKPSNMQVFKDETKMADQFVLSGVAKILDAKTKLDLDIAAK
ncbi:hypothetical protein [Paenibacillus sp. P36]|uniref:hypothetical protein n=1 Tax=Paenibacillus sp. P36 TaxID=3342538 RepID=UPI0038B304F3